MDNINIVLCGVGGQGTVLASKLTAYASMEKGLSVTSAETIGMAQRGGSVFSHLRIGEEIKTPMIKKGEADIIIAFEPSEGVRMLPYLKKDGVMVVNSCPVMPVTASLGEGNYKGENMLLYLKEKVRRLVTVDGEKACRELNSAKVLNTVLLGYAVETGVLPVTKDEMKQTIMKRVKPQFTEINMKALDYSSEEQE